MTRSHNAVERNSYMAEPHTCYSASCGVEAKWRIVSSARPTNPDGSPLTLFACDKHEPSLTMALRCAGTRYQLFPTVREPRPDPSVGWLKPLNGLPSLPVNRPVKPSPQQPAAEQQVSRPPILLEFSAALLSVVVMAAITPFVFGYYGIKWLFGWRPPTQ